MSLLDVAYYIGWMVLLGVAIAGACRMVAGPTTLDRMVGFDTLTIAVAAVVGLFSIHAGTSEYMELILLIAALGFFTTVAYYYYLSQPQAKGGEDFNEDDTR
jgi:multisubunit Na+/H+ antiporter MnhF subunit